MIQKVILYGNGASALGFLHSGLTDYNVLAVATEAPTGNQFEGLPNVATSEMLHFDFDLVVVASWAIHEISARLNKFGIPNDKILWFQHHKNRVLDWGHPDFYQSHEDISSNDILYCIYDMNVARATYDIIGFLCLAECERLNRSLSAIHVIVVNASDNDFNKSRWGIQNKNEHEWRIQQILLQSCTLLESCQGVSKTATRFEVTSLLSGASHVFPSDYCEESPIIEYEFDLLFKRVRENQNVSHLKANAEAVTYVKNCLLKINPDKKKVITVSLRDSISKPLRNSNKKEWRKFLDWLDKSLYLPIVIPDTENAFLQASEEFGEFTCLDVAAFNVQFRMALYELSFLNLGVNNGPIHLCALSPNCRYIMYKQVVENYPHSSTQSFIDRGFEIGGDFPGARQDQKFVWEDDNFHVIRKHFREFIDNNGSQEMFL